MNQNEFLASLASMNIHLDQLAINQFEQYINLLNEGNAKINLTAINEPDEVRSKHFFDSLSIFPYASKVSTLLDIGSGAGFPGIPLKIVLPDLKVTLIDPIGKRCTFLKDTIKSLDLKGITVLNGRAEDLAKQGLKGQLVTARAVANLKMLAELCIPLVELNGYFIAMKGSNGALEAKEATHATTLLGTKLIQEDSYTLQGGEQRVNLIYQKIKPTPKNYPRRFAEIKKKPL